MSSPQPCPGQALARGGVCPEPPFGHRGGTLCSTSAGPVGKQVRSSGPLRGPNAPPGPE